MSDKKHSLTVDKNKARKLGENVHHQYINRSGLFEKYDPPDYSLPKGMFSGSKEHALFLTYVFALDDMTNSNQIWTKAREIYKKTPWFFDAEQILTRSDKGLSDTLTKLTATELDSNIKYWRNISKNLLDNYDGDPRKLTETAIEFSTVITKTKDILDTDNNKKIYRYIQLMFTNDLLKIKKSKNFGVFIDRNIARFTIYTGIIKIQNDFFEGYLDKNPISKLTRDTWNKVVKDLKIKPWELDEPLSIIGNKLCPDMKCLLCPVYKNCEKKFNMKIIDNKIKFESPKIEKIVKIKFCYYCGRDLDKYSKYCDYCGRQTDK